MSGREWMADRRTKREIIIIGLEGLSKTSRKKYCEHGEKKPID
jgi:hypothetical protein